jgi:hypothetical protein
MTNFAQHSFATRVLRANLTLTVIALATLALVISPMASAETFMFKRADFVTGTGPAGGGRGRLQGQRSHGRGPWQ